MLSQHRPSKGSMCLTIVHQLGWNGHSLLYVVLACVPCHIMFPESSDYILATRDQWPPLFQQNRNSIFRDSFGRWLHYLTYVSIHIMNQNPHPNGDRGGIINSASVLGLVGKSGAIVYSSAKGSVVNMTRTTALDYAPFRIHVNAIAPGCKWKWKAWLCREVALIG
jgi:NAD(P)-dependent dehydrogenase (short-subunit alcohol dehydrogenase family)